MNRIASEHLPRRAFSLVELLVVIALIGILIALVFPAISNAMMRAQRIQCLNNLRDIGQAAIHFSQRRVHGRFPSTNGYDPTTWKEAETSLTDIRALIQEISLPPSIWYCPNLGRQGSDRTVQHPNSFTFFTPVSTRVVAGYVYMANPVGKDNNGNVWQTKWVRDPPFYRSLVESTTAPLAADICLSDRSASNTQNPLEAVWTIFPHDGINRAKVCNVVRMDGSGTAVELKDLAIGFSYDGPADLWWPK